MAGAGSPSYRPGTPLASGQLALAQIVAKARSTYKVLGFLDASNGILALMRYGVLYCRRRTKDGGTWLATESQRLRE